MQMGGCDHLKEHTKSEVFNTSVGQFKSDRHKNKITYITESYFSYFLKLLFSVEFSL